ncbi:hypothetical protein [Pseudomonas piscis]
MGRFEVFSDGQSIGWSDLEWGDPPMGVAFGLFVAGPGYPCIQGQVRALAQEDQASLKLTVQDAGARQIRAAGVCLYDYSDDAGADAMEVHVLGIECPAYDELFPEHVQAYERQFSAGHPQQGVET